MRVRAAALLWIVLGALFAMPAAAAEVSVLAAASLKEAMDEQARRFEAASGAKVRRVVRRKQRARKADRGGIARGPLHFCRRRLDGLCRHAASARTGHAHRASAQHARADRAGRTVP